MPIFKISRSSWVHLRIPFSFFLMPVYLFALAVNNAADLFNVIISFIAIHLFLYPASNGYNSYFDKDEKSIGLVEKPPPVKKDLYYTSIAFDVFAIVLGFFISPLFALLMLVYGLASKAYSHPWVRLKKYPLMGWFIAGFFQGYFTYIMSIEGINPSGWSVFFQPEIIFPASLCSLLLWGSYPMTQVYQHEEDAERGDKTLSLLLGVRGTFYFTAVVFLMANFAFVFYFYIFYSLKVAIFFQMFLMPVLIYFLRWYSVVHLDKTQADYRHTMELNMISAVCMNSFFVLFAFINSL
ncbi:MAG: UbiA prenyltransferase family protein [Cyclobacteriaceae bacterium]|nr:UbiA prenyltransferase family protein [Cyclobacteriaceae bacterium]